MNFTFIPAGFRRPLALMLALSSASLLAPASTDAAQTAPPLAVVSDYAHGARADALLTRLRDSDGFSAADLDWARSWLAQVRRQAKVLPSEANAKEHTLTWDAYEAIFVNAPNIAAGRRFLQDQRLWLDRAEGQYGVPPQIIAAILGVETKYGTFPGRYRALDALATLGYEHPTRAEFFLSELEQLFVLCRANRLSPDGLYGSYAGALGAAQFMPSNYLKLGVDFNSDGQVDLWTLPDAIGSIGNYFLHYRPQLAWHRGEPLFVTATVTGELPANLTRNGKSPDTTVGELIRAGLRPGAPLPLSMPAGLVELNTAKGPIYWIALNNFYSVMTYNPRTYYAAAVAALADQMVPVVELPPAGTPAGAAR